MGGTGSNDFGPMNAKEIITRYAAEEAKFEHKVVMITINKSIVERDIYNATRYAWRMSMKKAQRVEYVLAVKQGLIVGVFKPTEWLEATIENFPMFGLNREGRIGFCGENAPDSVRGLYLGKRIPDKYRKRGAANPIKYSF